MALGLVMVAGLGFSGVFGVAVEEPAFKSVLKDGAFEIRDYPALVVAEVTVPGDQKQAASRGFRLLAGYIFGANRTRQSIAMTAPVAQAPASQSIAMTAPVAQTPVAGQWVVRFTMPHSWTLASLPRPDDARVVLRETAPQRFAVIRFSGLASPSSVATQTGALQKWLHLRAMRPVGAATLAQYDPPWTIWFMRRNEVMIPIMP
jgi:hypothetical protein